MLSGELYFFAVLETLTQMQEADGKWKKATVELRAGSHADSRYFIIFSYILYSLSSHNILLPKQIHFYVEATSKKYTEQKKFQRAMPLLIPHFCCCLFLFRCMRKKIYRKGRILLRFNC